MGKILTCDCKHPFQDKVYGPAQRLHLPCAKDFKLKGYRCSVCSKEKDLPREDKPKATAEDIKTRPGKS